MADKIPLTPYLEQMKADGAAQRSVLADIVTEMEASAAANVDTGPQRVGRWARTIKALLAVANGEEPSPVTCPLLGEDENTSNPYVASCGTRFETYEECRFHDRKHAPRQFPHGMNAEDHKPDCDIRTSRDGWDAPCTCGVLPK